MKELYDITELFKIFKRFEKVVRDGKNREKSGKMSEPESPNIYYLPTYSIKTFLNLSQPSLRISISDQQCFSISFEKLFPHPIELYRYTRL